MNTIYNPKKKSLYFHTHFNEFRQKYPEDHLFLIMPIYKKLFPHMDKIAALPDSIEIRNNPNYINPYI